MLRRVVATVMLAAGGMGTYFMLVRPVAAVVRARSWAPSDCRIESAELTRHVDTQPAAERDRHATYGLEISYVYVVGGREYRSDRYTFQGGISSNGRARKARIAAKYRPGSIATCYVNPDAPGEAVLNRGFTSDMLLGAIPLVLLAFGIAGLGLVPPPLVEAVNGWAARRIERAPPAPAAGPPADPRHRYGLYAALALGGLALMNLLGAIGDEVSSLGALGLHLGIVAALTYGYHRRVLPCALVLLAYPVCLVVIAVALPPAWMEALWWSILPHLPGSLISAAVAVPDLVAPVRSYALEVAPLSVFLAPIGYGLLLGAHALVRESGRSPRAVWAAAAAVPALLIVASLASAAGAAYRSLRPETHALTEAEAAEALRGTDAPRRLQACRQAQSARPLPSALVAPILAAAAAPDEDTRQACLSALAGAGAAGKEAIPRLTASLADVSLVVRHSAAVSLGEIAAAVGGAEAEKAARAMVPLVSDREPLMRRFAVESLRQLRVRSGEVLDAYRRGLSDATPDVRQAAFRGLAELGADAAPAVPELTAALRNDDAFTRQAAAEALGGIGPAAGGAKDGLRRALRDGSADVRKAAVASLAKVAPGDADLVGAFASVLEDGDHSVRGAAILALEALGPKAAPAVPALIHVLSGSEIYLRVWAVDALGAIGPEARAALPRLRAMVDEKLITNESEALQIPIVVPAAIRKIEGTS